jgi:outer membrane protein assembly factor BamA
VEGNLALVYDSSLFGATSPLLGRRWRLEAGAVGGSLNYRTVLADARQYIMPLRPFTLASRVLYYGRHGSGANDGNLNDLFLGYPGLVRGYDPGSFDINLDECPADGETCIYDRSITGSQVLVANIELRFPLLGLFGGSSYFGPFPIEGALFADGGAAWSGSDVPKLFGAGHQSVSSVGAGVRVNFFGFAVVEVDYVRPLDRPVKGAHWQFGFMPGF